VWHTITADTWLVGLAVTPAILIGAYCGIVMVKKMSENVYRWFILGMTFIAAIFMIR
jgi:uncharacterized membrane protein YfcA